MGQGRVLVVDRDFQFVRTFSTALEREGYFAVVKHGLGEAMSYLQHHRPDILIVDFDLHVRHGGWGLVRQARRRWPNLPVVGITGHIGTKALEDAQTPVFSEAIRPRDPHELFARARLVQDQKRLSRAKEDV